uniref:Activin_recp domain-containing protein n=1 Tax=Strongyloides papillosus TaxID=174720 RepID=A0A0N5BXL9_STREA
MIGQFFIFILLIQTLDKIVGNFDDVAYCYAGDDSEITEKCSSNWCYTLRNSTNIKTIFDKGCDEANVFCGSIGNNCYSNLETFFNYSTIIPGVQGKEICCCNWTLCNSTSTQHFIEYSMTKLLSLLILLIFLLTNLIL